MNNFNQQINSLIQGIDSMGGNQIIIVTVDKQDGITVDMVFIVEQHVLGIYVFVTRQQKILTASIFLL